LAKKNRNKKENRYGDLKVVGFLKNSYILIEIEKNVDWHKKNKQQLKMKIKACKLLIFNYLPLFIGKIKIIKIK